MAGYIFNLDSDESLKFYILNGIYATKLSPPKSQLWKAHQEATFADYITMKHGDNVYFFIKRKIYGIGEMINLSEQGCKFSNYPESCTPQEFKYQEIKNFLLLDEGDFSINQRWICLFKSSPYFFKKGVDMDDVLSSNPAAFRMLRAFWKVSFIKFDDDENQAFKDVLLKCNQKADSTIQNSKDNVFSISNTITIHNDISTKLKENDYKFKISPFLESCKNGTRIKHEMAIEAAILHQLVIEDENTIHTFGKWDYLSHQVIASPLKPIDYMDKMDIFGYSYISGFEPTKSKYLLVEIKKEEALTQDIEQVLKYVDWIKDEYCSNNYSMIKSFLVAHNFSSEVIEYKNNYAKRQYTIGRRPAESHQWNDLKLIKYSYDNIQQKLIFKEE